MGDYFKDMEFNINPYLVMLALTLILYVSVIAYEHHLDNKDKDSEVYCQKFYEIEDELNMVVFTTTKEECERITQSGEEVKE